VGEPEGGGDDKGRPDDERSDPPAPSGKAADGGGGGDVSGGPDSDGGVLDDGAVREGLDDDADDGLDGGDGRPDGPDDDLGEPSDDIAGRHNALPRRVESWRSRSATGAIATAMAMGLQQVFEPERRRPAAVAEAPSDPYDENDPVTVDYVPDDAEGTRVHVKPWLLERQDPA